MSVFVSVCTRAHTHVCVCLCVFVCQLCSDLCRLNVVEMSQLGTLFKVLGDTPLYATFHPLLLHCTQVYTHALAHMSLKFLDTPRV